MDAKPPLIHSLTINNFRGIKRAEFLNFQRVNVLIGRFGSGKSAILEALSLFNPATPNKTHPFQRVLNERRGQSRGHEVRELFYAYKDNQDLSLQIQKKTGAMEFAINKTANRHRLTWHLRGTQIAAGSIADDRTNLPSWDTNHDSTNFILIDNADLSELQTTERLLNQLKDEGTESDFLKILQQLYPELKGYEIITRKSGAAPVRFEMGAGKIHIDYLADGIKQGMSLLVRVWLAKDSVMLLEEPDAHQYPGALHALTAELVRLAEKNNLQLIIATHSPEFVRQIEQASQNSFAAYHLPVPADGLLTPRPIKGADFQAMADLGWDVASLMKGFHKYVLVEGETDKRILDAALLRLKEPSELEIPLAILSVGTKPKDSILGRRTMILEPLLKIADRILITQDMDENSETTVKSILLSSLTSHLRAIGYTEAPAEGDIIYSKGDTKIRKNELEKSIIAIGDATYTTSQKHTIDDYTNQIVDAEPTLLPEALRECGFINLTREEAVKKPIVAEYLVRKARDLPAALKQLVQKIIAA